MRMISIEFSLTVLSFRVAIATKINNHLSNRSVSIRRMEYLQIEEELLASRTMLMRYIWP